VKLKPHEEPLRSEILSGKFTILNVRDPTGASIALFTARLHHPHKSVQHVVLQALFYLLDRAVDSFETQRNGLVFIYDMCGSNYANFELDLGKKVLNLLKLPFSSTDLEKPQHSSMENIQHLEQTSPKASSLKCDKLLSSFPSKMQQFISGPKCPRSFYQQIKNHSRKTPVISTK
ncbi:protein tyrosine phosphatase non-receptor type 9, partial [Homo sapiens]